jgi:succinate dehydrogenase/fumarate reductase cytochrome b subunit
MKKAFLMQAVQCQGCGLMAQLNPPTIMATEEDMTKAASDMHKASGIICAKPLMVLLYGHVLVANELVLAKAQNITAETNAPAPNGKGLDVDPDSALGRILSKHKKAGG